MVGGNLAAETGDELACRFRAVVVAARRGARGAAEGVSPALARRVTALADPAPFAFGAAADLVDFAGAPRASQACSARRRLKTRGSDWWSRRRRMAPSRRRRRRPRPRAARAAASLCSASLDAASAAPRRLALALNVTSPQASDALTDLPPDWVANPLARARVSLLCVAGSTPPATARRAPAPAPRTPSPPPPPRSRRTRGVAHAATCDAPPAPFERALGGFATVSVRVAFGTGIVRGMRFAELEFEWAAPRAARALVTSRDAYAPASATDAAALELVSGAFGDLARSSLREPAMPFFVASGTGRAFAGLNATRAYADADDMDPGGRGGTATARPRACRAHGARRRRLPRRRGSARALLGGGGGGVRRGGRGLRARAVRRARVVRVERALILVEPPAMPPRVADEPDDVLVGVSVDGGATFSDAAAAHAPPRARARAGHAR